MLRRAVTAFAPLAALMALASCGQGPVLAVNDAYVRLNPNDQAPSALYFTVSGGPEPTTLEDVLSPSAVRLSMHETARDPQTNVTKMEPILRVPIPAKTDVEFKPGGKHVMVYGVNLPARRLHEMDFTFVFGNGERIAVTAPIQEMDGKAASGMNAMDHGNMDMGSTTPDTQPLPTPDGTPRPVQTQTPAAQ